MSKHKLPTLDEKRDVKNRNKKIIVLVLALVVVILIFPTPHIRTRQEPYTEYETEDKKELVEILSCERILEDGYDILKVWKYMEDETEIVINISSTEEVIIQLDGGILTTSNGITTFSPLEKLYDKTVKVLEITFIRSYSSYFLLIYNPTVWGASPSAIMSGDIKAYHCYEEEVPITKYKTVEYEELLPWWMP